MTKQEKFDRMYLVDNDELQINFVDSAIHESVLIDSGIFKMHKKGMTRQQIIDTCLKAIDWTFENLD